MGYIYLSLIVFAVCQITLAKFDYTGKREWPLSIMNGLIQLWINNISDKCVNLTIKGIANIEGLFRAEMCLAFPDNNTSWLLPKNISLGSELTLSRYIADSMNQWQLDLLDISASWSFVNCIQNWRLAKLDEWLYSKTDTSVTNQVVYLSTGNNAWVIMCNKAWVWKWPKWATDNAWGSM